MRRSLVKFLIASISDRILPCLRFGVFQQNRPEADIAGRTWRSDTDITGSPLRPVKDRKFLRVRAAKSEWFRRRDDVGKRRAHRRRRGYSVAILRGGNHAL